MLLASSVSRLRLFALVAATAAIVAAVVGCSAASDANDAQEEAGESEDLSLVWEAWEALDASYAVPGLLEDGSAAGGAIYSLMALWEMEPYPFLTDLGRTRGQVPSHVPEGMADLWRAVEAYRQAEPDAEIDELPRILISGMMEGLPDQRALYLSAEELPDVREQLERNLEGSYLGIGARVVPKEGQILLFPFHDSPAEKAGIEQGDLLVAVEGVDIGDSTPREVGDRIRGEKGTPVRLQIQRATDGESVELDVIRGNVQLQTVASQLTQGGIGYMRISRFRDNTGQQVFDALEQLNRFDMLGLVLDLRFNPGGSAEAAADVAGHFLPPSTVFRILQDREGLRSDHRTPEERRRLSIDDLIVVVLVDDQTRGEAEAVAAVLQEAGRATVIGEHTLGEGFAYEIVELSDGSALYMPVTRWYTPSGAWMSDMPVQPDLIVGYEEVPVGPGMEMQFNAAYQYLDSQLPLFR